MHITKNPYNPYKKNDKKNPYNPKFSYFCLASGYASLLVPFVIEERPGGNASQSTLLPPLVSVNS